MRSWFLVCATLAGFALTSGQSVVARAADPKAKAAKKKGDELQDNTGIGKTLQWEDKVMGPDDKSAELERIRKAQAINKAAAEKAEKERAANAAREAKEKEAAAKAGPTTQKRGGEVALPTLPDEGPSGGKGKPQHTEISPKLETEAAKTPPPTLKPADDKFIDKLLKEEGGPKKKRAATVEDKELVEMLASEKPSKAATAGKKGKKDGVDDLLTEAEKAAPMPETKVKHETPEWAKPEIRERAYTPPPPAPTVQKEKPNDGIIRVVQGAAGSSSGSAKPAVATTTRTPPAPAGSGTRKQSAAINSRPGEWADPFSDPAPRKGGKQVASAKRQAVDEEQDDFRPARRTPVAPAPSKREASRGSSSSDWDDPFSDSARKTTGTRRATTPAESPSKANKAAPARGRGGKWDDPFTSNDAPAGKGGRPAVASRELGKHGGKAAVTPTSTHRAAVAPAAAAPAQGRWGALKKRR